MKRHLYTIILLLFTLASCSSLLEEEPYGIYSNKTFFQTEEDALSALLYAYLPINFIDYSQRALFLMSDVPTNQFILYSELGGKNSGGAENYDFFYWGNRISASTTKELTTFYRAAYASICRAHTVISNVEKMTNISEDARKQILGEAHFLLAYNYFMLVRTYGSVDGSSSVPLRTSAVEDASSNYEPYSTIEKVYGYIISQLETAESLTTIQKIQGRVDIVGVWALLSKVYLTLASSKATGAPGYGWVKDADEMYGKASYYAKKVLYDQDIYSLAQKLGDVYDTEKQATCPEHIFISGMSRNAQGSVEGTYSKLPQFFGLGMLNEDLYIVRDIETVEIGDMKPLSADKVMRYVNSKDNWATLRPDYRFYDTYSDKDLRKRLMINVYYNKDGIAQAAFSPSNIPYDGDKSPQGNLCYPACRKYTDPISIEEHCSSNLYYIRFAEVALIYAEAEGPTDEGYKWINKVRARAKLDPLTENLGVNEFRDSVYRERTWELAFEGHGLYDLRRTNRVDNNYITNKPDVMESPYRYFYPIPQTEIDLNIK